MPRIEYIRERLGSIITCPIGRSFYQHAGWRPHFDNIILSMTLLPDEHVDRRVLEATRVWLVVNDKPYMEAPAAVLMDHYVRRHGNGTAVEGALDRAAALLAKTLEKFPGSSDETTKALIAFYQGAIATSNEWMPVRVPKQMDVRVDSSRPIDAIAVIEVISSRDVV